MGKNTVTKSIENVDGIKGVWVNVTKAEDVVIGQRVRYGGDTVGYDGNRRFVDSIRNEVVITWDGLNSHEGSYDLFKFPGIVQAFFPISKNQTNCICRYDREENGETIMTNREMYKTFETRRDAKIKFCKTKIKKGCENCKAYCPTTRGCYLNWLSLECEDEILSTLSADMHLEREKRIQEVALAFVEQCDRNVSMAFQLAEQYIVECERREKITKEEGDNYDL